MIDVLSPNTDSRLVESVDGGISQGIAWSMGRDSRFQIPDMPGGLSQGIAWSMGHGAWEEGGWQGSQGTLKGET